MSSEITAENAHLHQANTAAPVPAQPKRLPWYRRWFQPRPPEWGEEEFVKTAPCHTIYPTGHRVDWLGAVYREKSNRTGKYRYFVRGGSGDSLIDAVTFEKTGRLIFL